jgi:thymidylate kinase
MKLIEKEKNRYSIVDGTEPVEAVQRKIRKIVAPFLPNDRLNRR